MNNEQQLIFLQEALKVVQDNPVTAHGYCLLIGYDKECTDRLMGKAVSKILTDRVLKYDDIPVTRICLEFIGFERWNPIFSPIMPMDYDTHAYIAMRTFFAVWLEETIEEAIAELIKK